MVVFVFVGVVLVSGVIAQCGHGRIHEAQRPCTWREDRIAARRFLRDEGLASELDSYQFLILY